MMDQEHMKLMLTILSLLGQNVSPEQVQRAFQEAERKWACPLG
jgi:hypothetical protein